MKILMVKTSSLGDIVQAFSLLPYLKKFYPSSQIDWVVEAPFVDLVKAHPLISNAIPIQTKRWRSNLLHLQSWKEIRTFLHRLRQEKYDVVFDLQGNVKSGIVTAAARSPCKVGFGRTTVAEWPNLLFTHQRFNPPPGKNIRDDYLFLIQRYFGVTSPLLDEGVRLSISQEEEERVESILSSVQGKIKILVCSGSNWTNKQLSEECLTQFLQLMAEQFPCHFLFAWGNESERDVAERVSTQLPPQQSSVVEKLPLPALQNMMARLDLVIAMDSLPLHLAAMAGVPTFSAFGASSSDKYKPVGMRHMAYQGRCPYGRTFAKRCPILRTCSTGACIKDIDSRVLFDSFSKWWRSWY